MDNLTKNNLIFVAIIFIAGILLSLIFKKIRKYVYSSVITTFVISLLDRNGMFYIPLLDRIMEYHLNLIERIQFLLLAKKDLLVFFLIVGSEINQLSINFIKYVFINLNVLFDSVKCFAKRAKLLVSKSVIALKQQIIKRTNLSRLKVVYRV